MCQAAPSWMRYVLMVYPLLVLLRPMLPPQAQGPAGILLAVLDKLVGNFGNCKNATPTNQQNVVTPRPGN